MERRAIEILGTVQGVGFRPFVHGLANKFNIGGYVRNDGGAVIIEAEGEPAPLEAFMAQLVSDVPPLARIEKISWSNRAPLGERTFRIVSSESHSNGAVAVSPDIATCDECLAEMFNPADRRYRYPFTNCTHCGPRLTIVTGAPYDRVRTTMAGFAMCEACRAEYENPADRRFHAQPVACARCGPRLALLDAHGAAVQCEDPLHFAVDALRQGKLVAVKGLGGYHLACDAANEAAVTRLRKHKHRDEKPLAIMVADLTAARVYCHISDAEAALLRSSQRPIVLLRKNDAAQVMLAAGVAPGNPNLGIMLPYTPLHHLLMHDIAIPLIMTSGNRADEPIATDESDAVERLSGIAELFLVHDRPIHVRCDDSVTRIMDGEESLIRRSRGYAPRPLKMPLNCPQPVLAVGGQLKAAFALAHEGRVVMSHHLGDLDDLRAYTAFERDIVLYEQLFALHPRVIAHDLHPDYASTRYAKERRQREGVDCIAVQHHHAHVASCMAEHALNERVIGVSLDGTGYGTDGSVWGCEFLVSDYGSFTRAAHLRYVRMPGGEQAVREPWRMAAAYLADAGVSCAAFELRQVPSSLRMVRSMLERAFNAPLTSSAGRLFDAVAALIGIRDRVSYEGQAAMQLQSISETAIVERAYPFELIETSGESPIQAPVEIDVRPMIRQIARDVDAGVAACQIGRRFHQTIAQFVAVICQQIRRQTQIDAIVLSGGVFMNALLVSEVRRVLASSSAPWRIYTHELVPPNDGGLSLGQAAVAAYQISLP